MFRIAGKNRKQRTGAADSWGYKIHDGAAQFRFELEGALAVGDVAELDQCWRTAASSIAGKTWVVDLTSLTAIDESGRQLLNRWRQAGAEFVAGPEFVAANGGSILGDCAVRSTDVRSPACCGLRSIPLCHGWPCLPPCCCRRPFLLSMLPSACPHPEQNRLQLRTWLWRVT